MKRRPRPQRVAADACLLTGSLLARRRLLAAGWAVVLLLDLVWP